MPTARAWARRSPRRWPWPAPTATAVTGRVGLVYAVNTVGAVSGSLAAGFLLIPRLGLQATLQVVSGCLVAAALVVVARAGLSRAGQLAGAAAAAVALVALVASPPWDRELLASGVYLYAPYVPKDLDLETLLKAGTLLYYQEGAAATVSVKRSPARRRSRWTARPTRRIAATCSRRSSSRTCRCCCTTRRARWPSSASAAA